MIDFAGLLSVTTLSTSRSDKSIQLEVFGYRCPGLNLETRISVKRAAGRPEDLEAIAELEAILEEDQLRTSYFS
jgi:hypothetical protein